MSKFVQIIFGRWVGGLETNSVLMRAEKFYLRVCCDVLVLLNILNRNTDMYKIKDGRES